MAEAITFIILTWNSENYINSCLKAIYDLNRYTVEVIVIDNGSWDNSVCKIQTLFPKTTVIKLPKNMGTTYTRNLGIKKSNPESNYICILDSDTIINQKAIDTLINCINKDNSVYIASPMMYNLNGMQQMSCKRFPTIKIKLLKAIPLKGLNEKATDLESYFIPANKDIIEVDYAISACWMMKRNVVERIGLLDEAIFYAPEDVDYCARVWEAGGKVILSTKCSIIHDTQRISKKKLFSIINFKHILGLIYYFYKHKYLFKSDKIKSNYIKNFI